MDVLPALLETRGLSAPKDRAFDGRSLWPPRTNPNANWPDRVLHARWRRGGQPELFRNHAAPSPGEAVSSLGTLEKRLPVAQGAARCVFEPVTLPGGPAHPAAALRVGSKPAEVLYVDLRRKNG